MKKSLILCLALSLAAAIASAGPKPQAGIILSQTSVPCGTKAEKKQQLDLICQQYIVRAGTTDYTIRQEKPADQALIPLNTAIEFTLDKSKMKFKANGKSYEYLVVGQAAATSAPAVPAPSAPTGLQPQ